METKTVTLKYPIERKGESPITKLTLREPRGKDLKRMDKVEGQMAKSICLIPYLCEEGITPEEVDELCAKDINALGEAIADFMGADTTGDPSAA